VRALLDTNAYSEMRRGHQGLRRLLRRYDELLLSTIVLGELLYGFRCGEKLKSNIEEIEDFMQEPFVSILPVDARSADRYSRVASSLRSRGKPIPTNDIWIGSQALQAGADIITFDEHFDHIEGLVRVRPD
jgi:tRNA(fMet)-specific endonuclease VapC